MYPRDHSMTQRSVLLLTPGSAPAERRSRVDRALASSPEPLRRPRFSARWRAGGSPINPAGAAVSERPSLCETSTSESTTSVHAAIAPSTSSCGEARTESHVPRASSPEPTAPLESAPPEPGVRFESGGSAGEPTGGGEEPLVWVGSSGYSDHRGEDGELACANTVGTQTRSWAAATATVQSKSRPVVMIEWSLGCQQA